MNTRTRKIVLIAGLTGLIIALTWHVCLSHTQTLDIQTDILSFLEPLQMEKVISLNLGVTSLFIVEQIWKCVDSSAMEAELLDSLTKVHVQVYETSQSHEELPPDACHKICDALNLKGWNMFVRVRDGDDHVLLFYQPVNETISGMLIVVLSGQDLVVVDMAGDLGLMLEHAIKHHGIEI
jgi:Domain of unknown function (DUF4252)